ncbi:D-Ala-D-Ala carboxypeptidase family metallohydrolase [Parvibaculum sp.]|uniref:D-Ala-D-Ala carboxypeptidase family metallohydrolase n=1 Tax=Parvibaculum sp. TaxID=2024848 RepID=UPI00260C9350|nr:D-Ala-D-Ala carboxypeptidase family metallohydrolase [Parvibaculum sp.]MCW5727263.1 hypothetical protein [Parvibaculum sp.]
MNDLRAPDGRLLFSRAELACKGTGMLRLAPGFGEKLVALRLAFGQPMTVTSCCRAAAHNARVGGHPRSLHVADDPSHPTGGTAAIDIAMRDGVYALKLLGAAERLGWAVGINFAKNFIHLDRRADFGIGDPRLFSY